MIQGTAGYKASFHKVCHVMSTQSVDLTYSG